MTAKNSEDKTTPVRKRDLIIVKIVDWQDDPENCEPAIDVEVYVNGRFSPKKSDVFPIQKGNHEGDSYIVAMIKAKDFAIKALMGV